MGYKKHRVVKNSTASSDLCVFGLDHLINNNMVKKVEIGAVVVVTSTPDHLIPTVSNIIQGECGLDIDVISIDISQGCVGFLLGLIESFMLLEHLGEKKVLLFNVDTLSKKVSKKDRNSYPLIGDAATVTIVENSPESKEICFNLHNDGTRRNALIIPAGGSRLPCSEETAVYEDVDHNREFA